MPNSIRARFVLRSAGLADAGQIAELSGQLGYPAEAADISARLKEILPDSRHHVVVAEGETGELLGWIGVHHRLLLEVGEDVEIVGLVVRAGTRRSGVGQALLAAAEDWARGRGRNLLRVRSNVARLESHPFYERMGYQRVKTQHCYQKGLVAPNEPK